MYWPKAVAIISIEISSWQSRISVAKPPKYKGAFDALLTQYRGLYTSKDWGFLIYVIQEPKMQWPQAVAWQGSLFW